MIIGAIDESQRKAAKVAGFTYLFGLASVIFAQFGIHSRLIVTGNAAETLRNIAASERIFRVSIACDLLYCAAVVILLTALYVILKAVNQNLALFAAFCMFVYALMWVLMTLNLFSVLRLSGASYQGAFEPERLQALAKLYLGPRFEQYYVGLLFYAVGGTVFSYLWFKSRYIPRVLAVWGVIAFAWCAACTFVFIMLPNITSVVNLWWFDSPMALFEIATSFWLLFKGLRPLPGATP